MPFGKGPGGGNGKPLGRVGTWGTEPGRPVGAGGWEEVLAFVLRVG